MFKQCFSKLATLLISAAPFTMNNHFQVSAEVTDNDKASALAQNPEFLDKMANAWITLGEFLTDRRFTDEERAWIAKAEIEHFQKDPQRQLEGLISYKPIFSKIKAIASNPVQLARYREDLFTEIHLNRVKSGNQHIQDYLTIVYRYSPVIATDVEAGLVVTENDLDSINVANNFFSQLAFETDHADADTIESLKQKFPRYWARASLENKRSFAHAEGRWKAFSGFLSIIDSKARQQLSDKIANTVRSTNNAPNVARAIENSIYYTEEERTAQAQDDQNSDQLTSGDQQKVEEFKSELREQRRAYMDAVGEANVIQGTQMYLMP